MSNNSIINALYGLWIVKAFRKREDELPPPVYKPPAKLIATNLTGEYRIALLEREGEKFFRIRSIDSGFIEYLSVETARDLAKFIQVHADE